MRHGFDMGTEAEQWERQRLLESLEAYKKGVADAPVVQKFAVSYGGTVNPDRPLTFVASDQREDRMGDVVRADGWDLGAYLRNPVFLWAHDHTRTPIGRSTWVGVDNGRLLTTVEFAPTEFAQEVETLYRQRFLRAVSVGFRPLAFALRSNADGLVEGVEFTKQELLEISAVPVPANPRALAKAMHQGLSVPLLRSVFAAHGAEGHDAVAEGLPVAEGSAFDEGGPALDPADAGSVVRALRDLRRALAG